MTHGLLACDVVSLGEWFQTFRRFVVSSSVVKRFGTCLPLEIKALRSSAVSRAVLRMNGH